MAMELQTLRPNSIDIFIIFETCEQKTKAIILNKIDKNDKTISIIKNLKNIAGIEKWKSGGTNVPLTR